MLTSLSTFLPDVLRASTWSLSAATIVYSLPAWNDTLCSVGMGLEDYWDARIETSFTILTGVLQSQNGAVQSLSVGTLHKNNSCFKQTRIPVHYYRQIKQRKLLAEMEGRYYRAIRQFRARSWLIANERHFSWMTPLSHHKPKCVNITR